jgi:hypothetical protein
MSEMGDTVPCRDQPGELADRARTGLKASAEARRAAA